MMQQQQDIQNTILESALPTFAKRGFRGASMTSIAEEAGVCESTINRYFESKDELIRQLQKNVEARMTAELMPSYHEKLPYEDRFLAFFTGVLRYLVKNPTESRFLEQFYSSPFGLEQARYEIEHPEQYATDPFYRIMTQGQEEKLFKDMPLEVLCAIVTGPLVTLSQERITRSIKFDDGLIQEVVKSCWDAVARQ